MPETHNKQLHIFMRPFGPVSLIYSSISILLTTINYVLRGADKTYVFFRDKWDIYFSYHRYFSIFFVICIILFVVQLVFLRKASRQRLISIVIVNVCMLSAYSFILMSSYINNLIFLQQELFILNLAKLIAFAANVFVLVFINYISFSLFLSALPGATKKL